MMVHPEPEELPARIRDSNTHNLQHDERCEGRQGDGDGHGAVPRKQVEKAKALFLRDDEMMDVWFRYCAGAARFRNCHLSPVCIIVELQFPAEHCASHGMAFI